MYVGAAQVHGPEGSIFGRENEYCPLRIRRGDRTGGCTALCVDRDGRVYAATPLGVQVFDPTGRLCGVTAAPQGRVEYMDFEGDKLTLWIGDTKHMRKLNTRAPEEPRKKQ